MNNAKRQPTPPAAPAALDPTSFAKMVDEAARHAVAPMFPGLVLQVGKRAKRYG